MPVDGPWVPKVRSLGAVLLLAGAPVAHALRVSRDLRVVDGDAQVAGQLAGHLRAVDTASGPLAVGGDEHDRGLRDGGARLDVALDAATGGDELLEMDQVGPLRASVEGAAAACVAPSGASAAAPPTQPVE